MAVITPDSDVILLKVPLEIDDTNQLTFATASDQYSYFYGLTGKKSYDKFTYQRKDGVIRIPEKMDDIIKYNYVMYRNEGYSNKWFYAYITGMEYINDSVTAVSIKTDCYQTWMFDLTYKPCFVEREHVNNDTIGLHTLPENVELGEYVINNTHHYSLMGDGANPDPPEGVDKWYVCFVVTQAPDPNDPTPIVPTTGYDIGATFSSLTYFAVKSSGTTYAYEDAKKIIEWYNDPTTPSTTDAIKNIYMIPFTCVDTSTSQTWTKDNVSVTCYAVKSSYSWINAANMCIEDDNLAGFYKPVNNKLYTYPYCYLYLSNKCGMDVTYHWEDGDYINTASTGQPADYRYIYQFTTAIVPSASLSAKLYPIEYKGKRETSSYYSLWNYGINFGKVPVCAWTTDYYTNWLTQNGVNVATQIGLAGIGAALGVATGGLGLVAGAAGLGTTVANSLAQMHKAQTTPDQAQGDINTGDVTFAYTFNNITAYSMTIKPEYSAIIDRYFSTYGYKINLVKIPNVTGRANWNYVKTIGCYISADIPQDDLQTIKNMFDKGVTFWHNASTFGDYSQSNAIVTPAST